MHGPYHAEVKIGDEVVRLDEADVVDGERESFRYFNSGVGRGLRLGFTRAVCIDVAKLVAPGETADITIYGRTGTEGRDAKEIAVGYEVVRRTIGGAALLSLGSKFNHRIWPGL